MSKPLEIHQPPEEERGREEGGRVGKFQGKEVTSRREEGKMEEEEGREGSDKAEEDGKEERGRGKRGK